jgi:3-oxoacyl-ACP reductase-like protein
MGLFNTLMSKIFSHSASVATATSGTPAAAPTPAGSPGAAAPVTSAPAATPAAAPAPAVDVAAIMDSLAARNSEKLDWQHSIVDLMKLVGMDSSLSARKELAQDLHYSGDMNDSAAMNMWLHKEVMKQLAANGGKVPQSLLDR